MSLCRGESVGSHDESGDDDTGSIRLFIIDDSGGANDEGAWGADMSDEQGYSETTVVRRVTDTTPNRVLGAGAADGFLFRFANMKPVSQLIRLRAQQPSPLAITLSFFGAAYAFDVEYCTSQNNQGECFGINVPGTGFACNDVRPGFEDLIQQVVIITAHVDCIIFQSVGIPFPSRPKNSTQTGAGCTNTSLDLGANQGSFNLGSAWIDQHNHKAPIFSKVSTVHAKQKAERSVLVVYFTSNYV
ncbi:hypothetical protein B0H19DRAFT_1079290 [Mycena capillaripes]|nr:hypothetical protein B0H19DRAFT_1079290 [Mycena capillaripes]